MNPDSCDSMNARSRILPIAFLGTLFLSGGLGGCLGPPRVETSIYEDQKGSVWLRTVSDASYHPSHPADISVETFEKVLTGLHYRRSPGRWLQRLVDSGAGPTPLFSPTQVTFWATHLRHAFFQVTAEEHVSIRIPLHPSSNFQNLTGILSLKHDDLHMALALSGHGLQSKTKPRRPDSLGGTNPIVVFLPKNAVKKQPSSWYQGTPTRHHLTIDMALLATLDGTAFSKDSKKEPVTPDSTPRHVPPTVIPLGQSIPLQRLDPSSPSDSQDLLEEIRSLRRELSRQKQELERLKKREAEPS